MASRSTFVALLVGALAGGCAEAGRSLVIVDVAAAPLSLSIDRVRVAVTATTTGRHWHVDHDWSGDVLKLGIYLPADFHGVVTTTACGFDSGGRPIAYGVGNPTTVTVMPGADTAGIRVTLAAGAGSATDGCAITDAGSDAPDAAGDHPASADGGADSTGDRPDATPDTESDGRDAGPDAPGAAILGNGFIPHAGGVGIDLTAVGTIDWIYWGLGTPGSFNHKASGGGEIGNLVPAPTQMYAGTGGRFDWTDGTPTTSASSVLQGVLAPAPGTLFLTVKATTTLRTLRVYQVVDGAVMMTLSLSDGSAPERIVYANFTTGWLEVAFRAATNGASLSVRWDILSTADAGSGGLGLFGAALF